MVVSVAKIPPQMQAGRLNVSEIATVTIRMREVIPRQNFTTAPRLKTVRSRRRWPREPFSMILARASSETRPNCEREVVTLNQSSCGRGRSARSGG